MTAYDYLVPTVVESVAARRAGLRPVLAAAARADHLHRHTDRRHGREPGVRADAVPRVRGSREGHQHLHQLARRRHHGAVRDLRHDEVRAARQVDVLLRPGGVGGGGAACRGHARASDSRSRTLASCSTSPTAAAAGQATDIELQAKEILRMRDMLNEMLANDTGQSIERHPQGHGPRLHHGVPRKPRSTVSSTRSSPAGRPSSIDRGRRRSLSYGGRRGEVRRRGRARQVQLLRQVAEAGQKADRRARRLHLRRMHRAVQRHHRRGAVRDRPRSASRTCRSPGRSSSS